MGSMRWNEELEPAVMLDGVKFKQVKEETKKEEEEAEPQRGAEGPLA